MHNAWNNALQRKLLWNAKHQSLLTALHISLLGTTLHVCNPCILEIVAARFVSHIAELRIKDMERFAWVMALFDFKSTAGSETQLANAILDELPRRTDERRQFPHSHLMCMNYMAMKGFHNVELIASVLLPDNLQRTYEKDKFYPKELLSLDSYTRINIRDVYQLRPQLKNVQRQLLANKWRKPLSSKRDENNLLNPDKRIANVAASVRTVFGHFEIRHALPHYTKPGVYLAVQETEYIPCEWSTVPLQISIS